MLAEARELSRADLIFPSRRTGGPLASTAFFEMLRRLGVAGTVHGFRTSFRTWAAEQPDINRQVAELALAHRVRGVEGVYQRSDLFDQRREIMERWAEVCASG